MPLSAGTTLGPYEIQSPLGAGGMGEVYRARDRRLDRIVAVKVLSEHLAGDPELRERFEREARAVSSLNHPHICTLHDIGEQDGVSYLVMEYLEGETMADRLAKGRLAIDEALRYALQLADALDKAHRRGVVHRDLKPGNIMLTKSGAKLMDFGLAKASRPAIAPAGPSNPGMTATPTISAPLTQRGSIVGTLQYMSPEQLEGRDADARTDIFAFGALLYEMVAGRRAFEGKSQVSIIAAIIDHDPPPLSSIQPIAPLLLDHLVNTCLAKDPDERWQTMADVLIQMRLIGDPTKSATVAGVRVAEDRRRAWLRWSAVGALTLLSAALAAALIVGRSQPERGRVMFELNGDTTSSPLHLALSPDGTRLVWVSQTDKGVGLAMRALDQLNVQILPGTATPIGRVSTGFPFWSPDGRFIGFFAPGKLKKASVSGAPPQTICDVASGFGGAWSRDGTILLALDATGPLYQVSASGGVPTPATDLDASRSETAHRHPLFLPDDKHFLYLATSSNPEHTAIVVGTLGSKERKRLVATVTKPGFVPPDHLLFMRDNTLMTQRLDMRRLEMQGDAIPIAEGVAVNIGNNLAGFTASNNGVLAWRSGGTIGGLSQLVWMDRSGKTTGTVSATAVYDNLALSPDLQRIAVSEPEDANRGDIWVIDVSRGTSTRFTFDPAIDNDPVWSPDGNKVVFASDRGSGRLNLFQKDAGGVPTENVLMKSDHIQLPEDWSADGRFVLFRDVDPKTGPDLWVLPMNGDSKPQPYLRSPFAETQARFSPNGRWVAYVSDESGRNEVYVQSFPASARKYQVSSDAGAQPRWRGDGKELYFLAGSVPGPRRAVAAVDVSESADTLKIGVQRALFETTVRNSLRSRSTWEPRRTASVFSSSHPFRTTPLRAGRSRSS